MMIMMYYYNITTKTVARANFVALDLHVEQTRSETHARTSK